jgi:hypothetical protein
MVGKVVTITRWLLVAGLISSLLACSSGQSWRTATRESANLAPDPKTTQEAVLQVYGADTWGWRGWFAIHTWISVKRTGEDFYTVYDVVGWRARRGQPVIGVNQDIPDRYWYGSQPELLKEYRGEGVDAMIDEVEKAALAYPWPSTYKAFPGPNSNTFIAWIINEVPSLEVDLPFSAIGSGYID